MSILSKVVKNKAKIAIYIALLLIITAGAVLRLHKLSTQSYWMDEGYTINAVLSILEKGSSTLDSGESYSCATYCYPTAYITKIFGSNAFSYRFFSAIAGIIFIFIIFIIVSDLFNTRAALLSSFLVSFSYWQIAWSRQARWYTLFAVFFWLSLYFFYKALHGDKRKVLYACLTVLFTILSALTHGLGYLIPFVFLIWIAIDQIFIKKRFSWQKTALVASLSIAIVLILEKVLHLNFIIPFFNNLRISYVLPYYLSFYLRNYWIFIILAIIALFSTQNKFKKEGYFLIVALLAYLLPLSFLTNIVHYRYLFHVIPALFILASIIIAQVYQQISKNYQKIILVLAVIVVFSTIGGGVIWPASAYYLESDNPETLGKRPHYAYTPQPDWNKAYAFIQANKKNTAIIISSHPQFNKIFLGEAGYWIKYDYLGIKDAPNIIENDREYYVGAKVINDLAELQQVTRNSHGYIVFDYMAIDGRIPNDTVKYIDQTLKQVFYEKTNLYSQIWVYAF